MSVRGFAVFVALASATGIVACRRDAVNDSPVPAPPTATASAGPAPSGAPTPRFSQRYRGPTGLVEAHYPPDFAARYKGTQLLLERALLEGGSEIVSFNAVAHPISTDLDEYARVSAIQTEKTLANVHYVEHSRRLANCYGERCIERVGEWRASNGEVYKRRAWIFLRGGSGFAFSYTLPLSRAAEDEPELIAMLQAVVFVSP